MKKTGENSLKILFFSTEENNCIQNSVMAWEVSKWQCFLFLGELFLKRNKERELHVKPVIEKQNITR